MPETILGFYVLYGLTLGLLVFLGFIIEKKRTLFLLNILVLIVGFLVFPESILTFLVLLTYVLSMWFGWFLKHPIGRKKNSISGASLISLLFIVGFLLTGCIKKVEQTPKEAQNIKYELAKAQPGDFVLFNGVLRVVKSVKNNGDVVIQIEGVPGATQPLILSDEWISHVGKIIHRKDPAWPDAAYNFILYQGYGYGNNGKI